MIIDTLENTSQYESLHPLFAKAFSYLKQNNPVSLPETNTILEDGLKVIITDKKGKTKEESLQKFECHDLFIDIQFCAKGVETIYWKPREKCINPNGKSFPFVF